MLNKAILVGRITRDPELKSTQAGVSVLNFTVAVPRKFKDANGERQSDFINCVAFRQTAEFIANWFKKGNIISIDGSIQTRNYERDGQRVYVTEVIVDNAGFVESRRDSETSSAQYSDTQPQRDTFADRGPSLPEMPTEFGGVTDDDLPF